MKLSIKKIFTQVEIPSELKKDFAIEIERIDHQAAKTVTLTVGLLIIVFAVSGFDYFVAPHQQMRFLLLRIVFGCACLFAFILSKHPRFKKKGKYLSAVSLLLGGWMIAVMVRTLGYQNNSAAGLNLVYLGTLLVPWELSWALSVCLGVYCAFLFPILMMDLPNVDRQVWIDNQFQIFTIAILAVASQFQTRIRYNQILGRLIIARQNKELETRERTKSEFIANVTHELKTPLAIVTGNTENILEHNPGLEPRLSQQLHLIRQSAFQLSTHVDRIINVANLDQGEGALARRVCDYVEVVRNTAGLFFHPAQEQGKTLTVNLPDDGPLPADIDMLRIEEVLQNLIQNALKFTPAGASIILGVTRQGEQIVTEVRDNGTGIHADKLPRIFDRLFQADDVLSKRHGGMGIGLYICKRNIEAHGGSISVRSEPGSGAVFTVTLPLKAQPVAIATGEPVLPARPFEYQHSLDIDALARTTVAIDADSLENKNPSKSGVLIVEDNPGMLSVLADSLADEYNLFVATDALTALDKLSRHGNGIALILSDIMMPGMSGFEFCEKVMADEHNRRIPLIFVTALQTPGQQVRGLSLGATDFITKPYNIKVLKEKIAHWISRRQYESLLQNTASMFEMRAKEVSVLKDTVIHEISNTAQLLNIASFMFDKFTRMMTGKLTEEENKDLAQLKPIKSAAKSLTGLIKFSRELGSGTMAGIAPVEIDTLFDDTISLTGHLLGDTTLSVDTSQAAGVSMRCDKRLLTQVFVNLVRNSVEAIAGMVPKVTGEIAIGCSLSPGKTQLIITVADNGGGMSETVKENLFKFRYTTKENGNGIGLHLSHLVVKLHGGEIRVRSEEGVGTKFTVTLPVGVV